jgi:flagellin-like protein
MLVDFKNKKYLFTSQVSLSTIFRKAKKGISPVVATALLLAVAVVAVVGFSGWFSTFSSQVFVDFEGETSASGIVSVEGLFGNKLYLNSKGNSSIKSIKINDIDCNFNGSVLGLDPINVSSCIGNVSGAANIVVLTSDKIIETYKYVDNGYTVQPSLIIIVDPLTFTTTWDVNSVNGSSGNWSLDLPLQTDGDYNFTVEWGDGNSDIILLYNQSEVTHSYVQDEGDGIYNVSMYGLIDGWAFNAGEIWHSNNHDGEKLIDIKNWGSMKLSDGGQQFMKVSNIVNWTANDTLNTSHITDMNYMFYGAKKLNQILDIDTSNVTTMDMMFRYAYDYNQPTNFNTSKVTSMQRMFSSAYDFQQELIFDTSKVTSMERMFSEALNFNSQIYFNTSKVTNMNHMFYNTNFNQNISNWDTSRVTDMSSMFRNSRGIFNIDVSSWDVSSVTSMERMFYRADEFNRDLSSWNVSNVTNMDSMFYRATIFNQNISFWCVTNIISEPVDFATLSALTALNKPVWGTCP